MSQEKAILQYNSISVNYLDEQVVQDASFSLYQGEILGIVGESGSGKSTLIKAAMGILNQDGFVSNGQIFFEGEDLLSLSERKLAKIRGWQIGMIFQDAAGSLSPIRTIGSQILECMKAKGSRKATVKKEALALFDKLNFKDSPKVWESYPFELSGGMNQRIAVAIAMLMKPQILLADEPTSALDNISRNQVLEELLRLKSMGTSIILVTHDINIVSAICDSVLVLKDGKISEYGTKEKVMITPVSDYTRQLIKAANQIGKL